MNTISHIKGILSITNYGFVSQYLEQRITRNMSCTPAKKTKEIIK